MKSLEWLSNNELALLNPYELRTIPPPSHLKRTDCMVYRVFQRWDEVFGFPPTVSEVAALLGKKYGTVHNAVWRLIDSGWLEVSGYGRRAVRVRRRQGWDFVAMMTPAGKPLTGINYVNKP